MKTYVTLATMFLILGLVKAETPTWQWAQGITGSTSTAGNAICTSPGGNSYVTGSFSGNAVVFGGHTLSSAGGSDIFVAKYDAAGNVLWAVSGGGTATEEGLSIATDAAQNVYLTGYFRSTTIQFGNITLQSAGNTANNSTFFIAKYDSSGNIQWAHAAGAGIYDYGVGITTSVDGSVYVTGTYSTNSITFDTYVLPAAVNESPFLVKYDAAGNVQWAKTATGQLDNVATGVTADALGNIYISGSFQGDSITFGAHTLINHSLIGQGASLFLVKYDPSGTINWAQGNTGNGNALANALTCDAANNIYISGIYTGTNMAFGAVAVPATAAFNSNLYVAKYNSAGTVAWAVAAGDSGITPYISAIKADAAGNTYLTGDFGGAGLTFGNTTISAPVITTYATNSFVTKYSTTGTVTWAKGITGKNQVVSMGIDVDQAGNAYATGLIQDSRVIFDNVTLGDTTARTMYVAKLANDAATDIQQIQGNNGISVYPNPGNGNIYFNAPQTGYDIEIYNVVGQLIATQRTTTFNTALNLTNQAKGIYIYHVTNNNTLIQQGKIVID